jgi:hypothetical protein
MSFCIFYSLFTVYHCNDQILLEHLDGLGARSALLSLDLMCFIVRRGSNDCSCNACFIILVAASSPRCFLALCVGILHLYSHRSLF